MTVLSQVAIGHSYHRSCSSIVLLIVSIEMVHELYIYILLNHCHAFVKKIFMEINHLTNFSYY